MKNFLPMLTIKVLLTRDSVVDLNRPFPSCLVPLFQNESWSIAFHMKMSFHSHADKTHFHRKIFARNVALKKRHNTIRKWPIKWHKFETDADQED